MPDPESRDMYGVAAQSKNTVFESPLSIHGGADNPGFTSLQLLTETNHWLCAILGFDFSSYFIPSFELGRKGKLKSFRSKFVLVGTLDQYVNL